MPLQPFATESQKDPSMPIKRKSSDEENSKQRASNVRAQHRLFFSYESESESEIDEEINKLTTMSQQYLISPKRLISTSVFEFDALHLLINKIKILPHHEIKKQQFAKLAENVLYPLANMHPKIMGLIRTTQETLNDSQDLAPIFNL